MNVVERQWVHTAYPQQVRVGGGQVARLRPLLKDTGARSVMVLATPNRAVSEMAQALLGGLGRTVTAILFDRAAAGVPAPIVQEAVRAASLAQIDTVISFGGGSTIDLGKAVCFFLEQQAGTPGLLFTDRPVVTHIAVPTTFSTAEGSAHFAMTDPQTRQLHVTGGPTLAPRYVVADPSAVETLPGDLVAATGLVALAHAIDAALSPRRTPESEAIATAAVSRTYGALLADPAGDLEARQRLQEGAVLAARAWQYAGGSLAHGLAQLLVGRAGVPYARALVAVVGPVLQFNAAVLGAQLEQVAWAVGSSDLAATIEELRGELGLAGGLSELGVDDAIISAVARMSQANPHVAANLRQTTEIDVAGLLEASY